MICRNILDGSLELFRAKNVILATGGAGQAWKPTTNALICTATASPWPTARAPRSWTWR